MRQKKRILIVDDEPDLLDSVTKLLTKDYDVVGAVDGVEALARIRTEHFDAVIVDLVMPLMDGALLKRTMDVLGWRIPVILLSATADVATTAQELGAADHVKKPFEADDLTSRLARVVGDDGTGLDPAGSVPGLM
jgi:DNA-binding NtrC family response regulator